MNMQLKQALEKCNVLNNGEIYCKIYGIDSYAKSARFELGHKFAASDVTSSRLNDKPK